MRQPAHRAFSLIELLTVIAILAILIALSVPATTAFSRSSELNRAGQAVSDQLLLARQEAITRNRPVEMKIFRVPAGTGSWSALQSYIEREDILIPLGRVVRLPAGIAAVSEHSSLITSNAAYISATNVPPLGSVDSISLRFHPNGSLDAMINTGNNVLTLANAVDAAEGRMAKNFYCIVINPVTGKIATFRP